MIDNCDINILAKNQVSAIFHSRAYSQKCVTQIYRALYEDANVGAHPDGHQHGGRKPAETSVTEFCSKSGNLSPEELKNSTVLLSPMQELFR